jgi:hypothetical protein
MHPAAFVFGIRRGSLQERPSLNRDQLTLAPATRWSLSCRLERQSGKPGVESVGRGGGDNDDKEDWRDGTRAVGQFTADACGRKTRITLCGSRLDSLAKSQPCGIKSAEQRDGLREFAPHGGLPDDFGSEAGAVCE